MSAPLRVGDLVELTIDRLAYDGGRGVARHEGFVIFVGGTAPNEKIKAKITTVKKNFAEGVLQEIVKPSAARRQPPCPVVHRCGGCPLQHIEYAEQLNQKKSVVEFQLKKHLANLSQPLQVFQSPNEYHYRNRVQIHVRNDHGRLEYGYFAPKTNELIPAQDCMIADPLLFQDLKTELKKLKFTEKPSKVELAIGADGRRRIRDLRAVDSIFSQVNSDVNKLLSNFVFENTHDYFKNSDVTELYDLYCGDGNLSFPLRAALPEKINIHGVELSPQAISRAQHKAQTEQLPNMHFYSHDVGTFLQTHDTFQHTAIVLDPPRAGLGPQVTTELLRLKSPYMIYVSCNLSTLARDLDALSQSYAVTQLAAFDMFPQTEYVETVAILLPRDNI
jgi:23S rRNA (uracil1939-C5)-methyltransferase